MLPEPLITTVIPTYRRPYMLRRAIRSVLDQTYPHFKICVYDNASSDETAEVVSGLASRDSRIRYHCHPENIGAQDNFIFGLSQVDTPLVHLISDDDFLLPGFFAQATSALNKNPNAAFFSGGMLSANPDGRVRGLLRYGTETDQVYSPPKLFELLAPYTRTWTSAVFRCSSLEALGGLRKETGYSFSIDLILRSATRFEAVLSDTPGAVFTVHSGSSSVAEASEAFGSLLNLAFFDSINKAIDSALKDEIVTERDADEMKTVLREVMERIFFRGAFGVIARGDLPVAVQASKVLAKVFKRRDLAAVINAAASDNKLGSVVRLALRSAKGARKLWFTGNRRARYPAYSEMVKSRMLQLST
jgi:glycosyltransferase involved in cell wall biosynthesis